MRGYNLDYYLLLEHVYHDVPLHNDLAHKKTVRSLPGRRVDPGRSASQGLEVVGHSRPSTLGLPASGEGREIDGGEGGERKA